MSAPVPSPGRRVVTWRVVAGVFLLLGVGTSSWWPGKKTAETFFLPERYTLPQEAVVEVPVRPAAEVKERLAPDERVIGVAIGGQARAYPVATLEAELPRKVLNDILGGQPIAVTWCDKCHNAIVFSRLAAGRTLVLAVSGQLWHGNMVMYDSETHSLWSQLQGQAMLGALKGTSLEVLPAVLTDWRTWSRSHPVSSVAWFDGLVAVSPTVRPDPATLVLGIAEGGRSRSWSIAELARRGAINDSWNGRPVVAVVDRSGTTARLYSRESAGRTLTFRLETALTDEETGNTWDPVSGKATSGPLAGEQLVALPAVVSFRTAWLLFHPHEQTPHPQPLSRRSGEPSRTGVPLGSRHLQGRGE